MNIQSIQSTFNARTTAAEVIQGIDLANKLVVVTGGATGIGKETARTFASAGANVVIGARNRASLDAAVAELNPLSKGKIYGNHLDLLSMNSVAEFADRIISLNMPVDLLILNAAVMACPLSRSGDGIECHLATNYVGHALLTSKLVGKLLDSPQARVVSLSSTAHQMSPVIFEDINFLHRPYDPWEAYAQSKTATALLASQVWHTLGNRGVTAHTLRPGGIQTGLLKHITWDLGAQFLERYHYDVSNSTVKTIPQGAATTIWAATAPELLHREVAYLEDCKISPLLEKPQYSNGVMPYALDRDNAQRLWDMAEQLCGTRFNLNPS